MTDHPVAIEIVQHPWWQRAYWWIKYQVSRLRPRRPGNLERHAERELRAAGLYDKDSDYGGMMAHATMKLIKAFAAEGHSGMSAGMQIIIFEKLARFEPLCPLTGEDDEWNEIDDGLYQNNRCGRVFKKNGEAYDIDGKVFREVDPVTGKHIPGASYTSKDSSVPVTFPYTPTTEYVDVPSD